MSHLCVLLYPHKFQCFIANTNFLTTTLFNNGDPHQVLPYTARVFWIANAQSRSTGARTFCGRFPAFLPQNQLPPKSSKLLSALSTLNQSPAAVMAFKIQARSHGSSHGHHHHNSSYLTSSNKKDPAVRITRIGLFVNLGMAIGKGIGGYYFNSQALVADGKTRI
jgi:hypothetical protein